MASRKVPGHPHLRYSGGALSPQEEHINALLLDRLEKLAEATGKTLTIFSGSGGPGVRHAGFSGDPHARGLAADVSVGGRPIGEVIPVRTIQAFGIRSGNVSGFYKGRKDPAHVDLIGEPGRVQVRGNVGQGWEVMLLHQIGAPITPANIKFLNLWHDLEGGSAHFNPLNTTQGATGASNYNSVGVKNYRTANQGITATARTLKNGRYPTILAALRSGQPGKYLAQGNRSQRAQKEAGTWGTGGHLITNFLNTGGGSHVLGTIEWFSTAGLVGHNPGGFFGGPALGKSQKPLHDVVKGTVDAVTSIPKAVEWLSHGGLKRVGMITLGALMLLMGVYLLAKEQGALPK